MFRFIAKRFWLFGPSVGLIAATLAALIFTVWDWIENPSGIFHDASGTNWNFVYDTAVSWFFPTLLQTTLTVSAAHLLIGVFVQFIRKHSRHRQASSRTD